METLSCGKAQHGFSFSWKNISRIVAIVGLLLEYIIGLVTLNGSVGVMNTVPPPGGCVFNVVCSLPQSGNFVFGQQCLSLLSFQQDSSVSHVWVCKTIDFTRRRSHVSQKVIRFGEIFRSEFGSMNLVYVKNENFLVVLPVDFHNL